ncbi:right-handed parallel beta-helix repeat-containing protein [Kamptonema cortianum]|nr:right-handed parallel beta-helix repeat-containing protein [Kamptonema cortianum]
MISLHVCPLNGNDGFTGFQPVTNAQDTNGPLRTLVGARNRLRQLRREGKLNTPVRVILSGGTHRLSEPLILDPQDSGTADSPVCFTSEPGRRAVISGGRKISGWKVSTVNGVNCWSCEIPALKDGSLKPFIDLYVNGRRALRPRSPREAYFRLTHFPEGKGWNSWYSTDRYGYEPGSLRADWHNRDDVEVVMIQAWFESHLSIRHLDEEKHEVTFYRRPIGNGDDGIKTARYYVENVFEMLKEPGQWYLDTRKHLIFYIPLPGQSPENTEFIIPELEYLVRLNGSLDSTGQKVSHVHFENLTFTHCQWRRPREHVGAVQSAYVVPGAVQLRGSHHCLLQNCTIHAVGQYAVEIAQGSHANRVLRCHFHDLGAGGVKVNHERPVYQFESGISMGPESFGDVDWKELGWQVTEETAARTIGHPHPDSAATEIADCRIHDGGKTYPSACGVWIGDSGRNHIHHNEIFDLYYTAVSVGWTWGYHRSCAFGNVIEYNHLHHIGKNLLSDMGGVYLLGPQPGTVIRNNIIHDVESNPDGYGGYGLYPDQGGSYMLFENNIVYRCRSNGFHQNWGRDNIVRNNVFAFSGAAQFARGREECVSGAVIERNIIDCRDVDAFGHSWHYGTFFSDHNLFWCRPGRLPGFHGYELHHWHAMGLEKNSLVADPLFTAAEAGDFSLPPDSPAFGVGFCPIDVSDVGPRRQPVGKESSIPLIKKTILHPHVLLPDQAQNPGALEEYRKLATAPASFNVPTHEIFPLRFVLENRGASVAEGEITAGLRRPDRGTVEIRGSSHYSLRPGEIFETTIAVRLNEKATDEFVRIHYADDHDLQTGLFLSVKQPASVKKNLRGRQQPGDCAGTAVRGPATTGPDKNFRSGGSPHGCGGQCLFDSRIHSGLSAPSQTFRTMAGFRSGALLYETRRRGQTPNVSPAGHDGSTGHSDSVVGQSMPSH